MSEPLAIIRVPWDVQRTSQNTAQRGGHSHWAARGRVNRAARERARLAWLEAGAPTAEVKVRVRVIVRRARALDTANAIGGLKPLIDGIFVRALTRDDSPRWLEFGGCTQETGAQWKGRESVVFIVEAAETSEPGDSPEKG